MVHTRKKKKWILGALHKGRKGALHRRLGVKGVISIKRLRKEERTSLRLLKRADKSGNRRKIGAAQRRLSQVRFAITTRMFRKVRFHGAKRRMEVHRARHARTGDRPIRKRRQRRNR